MSDIIKTWVEGEIFTLVVPVGKYDPVTMTTSYGTQNVNLSAKDVYVEFFDAETHAITPLLQKNRVAGSSTTGISIDEDANTKSNLEISFSENDYTNFNANGKSTRRIEMRARYKVGSTESKSIIPYADPSDEKTMIRFYIDLVQKLIN